MPRRRKVNAERVELTTLRVYTGEVLFIRIFAKTALGRAINFLCIALGIVRRVNRMFSQFSFNNLVLLLQFTVQLYFGNEKHDEPRSRAINRFIGSPFNSRIDTVPRIFRLYKGSEMESEGPSETKSHPMKRQHLRKRTKLFQDRIGILIQSGIRRNEVSCFSHRFDRHCSHAKNAEKKKPLFTLHVYRRI